MPITPSTRASLLVRLRDTADHEAWLQFVELYEPAVARLARRAGLQDADAREVVQELLLAVARKAETWDADPARGSFRGWLRSVARNLVVSWMRRHGRRRKHEADGSRFEALFDDDGLAAPDRSPEDEALEAELRRARLRRAARQARREFEASTWEAFRATAIQGCSAGEAAARLGLSPGAVRVAKCRVLARLRELVQAAESEA
jgi:RNA polymerase sigma-70 factor (ECF subfamily)